MISRRLFLRFTAIFGVPAIDLPRYLNGILTIPADHIPLKVDFKVWVIQPQYLLDLEFGFLNVRKTSAGNLLHTNNDSRDSFLIIRLPQLHISEETYLQNDPVENAIAASFIAGPSYLIFKIRSFADFALLPSTLMNWNHERLELVLLDKGNYPKTKVDYDKTRPYPGLTTVDDLPITSFEVPYGVTLAPISNFLGTKSKGIFSRNNQISNPTNYIFPNDDELTVARGYFRAIGNNSEKDNHSIRAKDSSSATEMWYNDLSYTNSDAGLLLKVIDLNNEIAKSKDAHLIPDNRAKELYKKQFVENDPNSLQVVRVTSKHFRISALGLTANLDYVSSNVKDILQKLYQEIILSRDKYIEVDTLGYIYPLGIRVVLVKIGSRKIRQGAAYIESRTYIAPLEKTISYRTGSEQDVDDTDNSVLQRTPSAANPIDTNYINSCKRSFPFQQIEVLTKDFIEIVDYDRQPPADGETANIVSRDKNSNISAFWPVKQQQELNENNVNVHPDVKFQFAGTDWDCKKTIFESAFIFVSGEAVNDVDSQCQIKQEQLLKLQTSLNGTVDEEFIFITQDLQYDKQQVYDLLFQIKNGAAKDLVKLQQVTQDLAIKLYKRYEDLKSNLPTGDADILGNIASIVNGNGADDNGLLTDYKARIVNWGNDNRVKGQHLLYITTFYYSLEKARVSNYSNAVITSVLVNINISGEEIATLAGKEANDIKATWYQQTKEFYRLDDALSRSYHTLDNEARRKITLNNEKISYYKTKLEAAEQDGEQKINELETHYIAFASIPVSNLAELRRKAVTDVNKATAPIDNQLKKIKDFSQQYNFSYPQLLAAQVSLPVVKELMSEGKDATEAAKGIYDKDKLAVIAYADAYRVAGIEGWDKAETGVKKNAERVLFDIQDLVRPPKDAAAIIMDRLANDYRKDIKAPWELLQRNTLDYEVCTIGYAKTKISNIFAGAEAKVGGLMNPGVVISQISAIKGKAYTLNNDINRYKGEINSYLTVPLKKGQDIATAALARDLPDAGAFEKNIKDYAINKEDQVKGLLKDINLFGLSLGDLIKLDSFSPGALPSSEIKVIKKNGIPVGTRVTYGWNSPPDKQLFDNKKNLISFLNGDGQSNVNSVINLSMSNVNSWDGEPTSQVNSSIALQNFGISAVDVIKIYFKSISYTKGIEKYKDQAGSWQTRTSSSLQLAIGRVEFSGFLELIKQLEEALGLGNNFLIDANTEGITISYGIRIPTISTGAFNLSNFTLYAGLVLSFKGGPPLMRFSFSERANPFTLAVGIYGGRGFFAVNVSSKGIERMEGSLEFGGYLAIDIAGIARGQAFLMAGIYFRQRGNEDVYVESYLTCGGSLSIIGIIQISIVFYLGMSYQGGALKGRASVDVSISILFFSASYNLTFEKQISGSKGVSMNSRRAAKSDQTEYLATSQHGHGPYVEDILFEDSDPDKQDPIPYRYLFIEDVKGEWTSSTLAQKIKKSIPVYDPGLLLEDDMDLKEFNRYVNQY